MSDALSWYHPLLPNIGEVGGGESDETSRIFCGHVNFPEMNWGIVSMVAQSRIIIKRGLVITNNTLQKKKHQIIL